MNFFVYMHSIGKAGGEKWVKATNSLYTVYVCAKKMLERGQNTIQQQQQQ